MTNEEIARFFNDTRAIIQGNPDLRDPQVEGWFRTRQHFRAAMQVRGTEIALGTLPQAQDCSLGPRLRVRPVEHHAHPHRPRSGYL